MPTHTAAASAAALKPQVGVGVLVVREGKILLGKRKGAHGSGAYNLPGGHLEFKETIEACAERELAEETGLKPLSLQLGPWTQNVMDQQKHYITFLAMVTKFEGEPQLLEPHKCEGWAWHAWEELPKPLFSTSNYLNRICGNREVKGNVRKTGL